MLSEEVPPKTPDGEKDPQEPGEGRAGKCRTPGGLRQQVPGLGELEEGGS